MSNKRYVHEEAYRGEGFAEKLSSVNIAICGAGTVGSNLADTLARQGCRSLRLIDMDRVEEHNINTQIYGESDIGALKVEAARNRLFRDVGIELDVFDKELTDRTVRKFLRGADLIIDAFDNRAARLLLQTWSRDKNVPCLHAGLFEDYGEVVWDEKYTVPQDVDGDVCEYPLARNLAMLVVSIIAEEILDFCLAEKPRKACWSVTLKDLQIKPY